MAITIQDVCYNYSHSSQGFFLGPIKMDIPNGRVTCWCGPNGSGKTTLARILIGELSQTSGKIIGADKYSIYHSQNPASNLFSDLSVKEHFAIFSEKFDYWTFAKSDFPTISNLGSQFPDELSGGEKQLVGFIVSTISEHTLFVFDELLNYLSRDIGRKVMERVTSICIAKNTHCVLITHDIETVKLYADSVFIFNNGQIVDNIDKSAINRLSDSELSSAITCQKRKQDPGDASSYFSLRAPRYQKALATCPNARLFDMLPYVSAFNAAGINSIDNLRICDAFGGTGFLSRSLLEGSKQPMNCKIDVYDCCEKMLEGVKELPVTPIVTNNDFQDVLDRGNKYDAVLCHGGLHHVVQTPGGSVDVNGSQKRQELVCKRLACLLNPGGVLIIADIPRCTHTLDIGVLDSVEMSLESIKRILGNSSADILAKILGNVAVNSKYTDIQAAIIKNYWTDVAIEIPKHFFDSFVASNTRYGHVASYPLFNAISKAILDCDSNIHHLGTIDFKGPWIFKSIYEAGWFFKEKFSYGNPSESVDTGEQVKEMVKNLESHLGIKKKKDSTCYVNWGVTYSIYSKNK